MRARAILTALPAIVLTASAAGAQAPLPAAPAPGSPQSHTRLTIEQLFAAEVPMVRGASRFAQQVVDAPSSITIVTREEIERFGYQTLADVLRGIRGFYVTYDRNYTYVGTRGLARPGDYNTRILLLVNGHRLNDNVYDQAMFGTEFPVDLEIVDRIEIVRGPSSSLYGTSAFLAVVNVLTRGGAGADRLHVDAGLGSLGTRSIRASTGRLFGNGFEALVSASTFYREGQGGRDPEIAAPGMDVDEATRLFGAVSKGAWSAQTGFATRRKVIPTGAYGTRLDDPRSHTVDARAFAGVAFDRPVGRTQLTARASQDWYMYDGSYVYEEGFPYFDGTRGVWTSGEVQAVRKWSRHTITGGSEARFNSRQDQWGGYETSPVTIDLDDRRSSATTAVYIQDEWRIAPWALLNAGLRHDHSSHSGGATSPRAALILKPSTTSAVKLLHGRAFRAPNMYESYYYTATPPLDEERITTNEVVAELYRPGGVRLAATAFVYRVSGLITQSAVYVPEPATAFRNAEQTRAAGTELEAERAWPGGWRAGGSYTYQAALEADGGERLSNSPAHMAALRGSGPLVRDRVSAGLEMLFTSERLSTVGTPVEGHALLNATVRSLRPLPGGLSWALHVRNLFDARYFDPGTDDHPVDRLRQDGRTVSVNVSWSF